MDDHDCFVDVEVGGGSSSNSDDMESSTSTMDVEEVDVMDIDISKKNATQKQYNWHAMSREDTCAALGLSTTKLSTIRQTGLSNEEVQIRLEQFGENKLTDTTTNYDNNTNNSSSCCNSFESIIHKYPILVQCWRYMGNILCIVLMIVALVSLSRGIVADTTKDQRASFIEVGLIVIILMYVYPSEKKKNLLCFVYIRDTLGIKKKLFI